MARRSRFLADLNDPALTPESPYIDSAIGAFSHTKMPVGKAGALRLSGLPSGGWHDAIARAMPSCGSGTPSRVFPIFIQWASWTARDPRARRQQAGNFNG
jgi:hypothetical protein